MKTFATAILFTHVAISSWAQTMHVKVPNYSTFTPTQTVSSGVQDKLSSPKAKEHPEYGVLPYNAPCSNCFELLDKRTETSRVFVDAKDESHIYSQQSQLPVSYKEVANGPWLTIDHRLKPTGNEVYVAAKQPVPTTLDLKQKQTSLNLNGFEFAFNQNLALYFVSASGSKLTFPKPDYNNYTIGEEGLKVYNAWPGIEMHQQFRTGEVEATYVIRQPLKLPVTTGYMVIEDHFTLPTGYTFSESPNGTRLPGELFQGDYELRNTKGELLAIYSKPVYFDTRVYGSLATYRLLQSGNNYTLEMLIPVEWLQRTDNVYPIYIDPVVYGVNKLGNYNQSGLGGANLGFTSKALGTCDYHLNVSMPANNVPVDVYAELEYRLTFDISCGSPPLPAPFCTFSQAKMEVLCDSCGTSSGLLACDPAQPPYTGTCTTDSNLVPTAAPLSMKNIDATYLSCFPYQTTNYSIDFTLKNTDSTCGDVCGYLCARGTMWRMTVEARTCPDSTAITQNGDTLFCYTANGVQWYLNDSLIPGATSPYLVATQNGIYSALITDNVGCISPSYPYTYTVNTGLTYIANNYIRLFPNPASNSISVSLGLGIIQSVHVKDLTGRKVITVTNNNKTVETLDISSIQNGMYIIEVVTLQGHFTGRFIKQ